jgi:hypothetical protein
VLCAEKIRMALEFVQSYSMAEFDVERDQAPSEATNYLGVEGWVLCGGAGAAEEGHATWLVNALMQNAQALCNMCTAEVEEYCEYTTSQIHSLSSLLL